jgi:hypothetical protein
LRWTYTLVVDSIIKESNRSKIGKAVRGTNQAAKAVAKRLARESHYGCLYKAPGSSRRYINDAVRERCAERSTDPQTQQPFAEGASEEVPQQRHSDKREKRS